MLKQKNHWLSLFVLMLAAVIFVTAELVPIGILPEISTNFHQSIGIVGLIVTGYAWTVMLSAVLITTYFSSWERRKLLFLIMMIFAIANLIVACATALPLLFLGRILGAFSHGVFWASVGSICVKLITDDALKSRATAIVFGGIAIATVFTIPIGTLMAQHFGWRVIFIAISAASILAALCIYYNFPKIQSSGNRQLQSLPRLLCNPLLRRLFPATALALTGHFCAFTYISVLLEKVSKIPHHYLAFYLFLFGVAGIFGNVIAGMLNDKYLLLTSKLTMLGLAISIIVCAWLPSNVSIITAIFIAIWGAGICILTVGLQSLILTLPASIVDAASAIHVSMFNAGIGAGAFLGGIIADKLPLRMVACVGSVTLLVAAIILSLPFKENPQSYDYI